MPTVAKTVMTSKPATNKPLSGSILSRAVDVSTVSTPWLKINIYGGNRVGKTTLACTFPKPLLLVSFEPADAGGAESVADVSGVKFLQNKKHFSGKNGFIQLVGELKGSEYRTCVLDSLTSMSDWFLAEALGLNTVPEQQEFGKVHKSFYMKRAEQLKEALRPFLELQMNIVILAKEKDYRSRNEEDYDFTPSFAREAGIGSHYASDAGGSVAGWIQDACPFIVRMFLAPKVNVKTVNVAGRQITQEEVTNETVHRLRILHHPNFATGTRTLRCISLPEYLDEPDYDKLVKIFKAPLTQGS
jgi:hypothetical protein